MVHPKKGFTLIELLVAGTVIAILAVLATIAYRGGVAETRLSAAKANIEVLANAYQRLLIDRPGVNLTSNSSTMQDATTEDCTLSPVNSRSPSKLISCGYIENRGWNTDYFEYELCGGPHSTICAFAGFISTTQAYACMSGRNTKLPAQYQKSTGYVFCIKSDGGTFEKLGK